MYLNFILKLLKFIKIILECFNSQEINYIRMFINTICLFLLIR